MTEDKDLAYVRRQTRRRLLFSLVVLVLYFGYLLNYLPAGSFLGERLGSSGLTGSLGSFAALILVFIFLELVFLYLESDRHSQRGED